MSLIPPRWSRIVVVAGFACVLCFMEVGCGNAPANSETPDRDQSRDRTGLGAVASEPGSSVSVLPAADDGGISESLEGQPAVEVANPPSETPAVDSATGDAPDSKVADLKPADPNATSGAKAPPDDPARPRTFVVEGPADALRVGFDDLDLMKLINMDPVTSDCVEKMPGWLRDLNGKQIRIRGYMKPSGLAEGIPEFVFVRSTDLCCFGPKGKVYHLIAVKLKPGTTTDYIELKPFDVTGKFRIEKIELDDGLIFLLYHIDDATIIRK